MTIIAIIAIIYICESIIRGRILGLTGPGGSIRTYQGQLSYRSKNIVNLKALWCMHLLFGRGRPPRKRRIAPSLTPTMPVTPRTLCNGTEPHIWPKVYIGNTLPKEPIWSGISTSQAEQTIAWPKYGHAGCSHGFMPIFMEPFSMGLLGLRAGQPLEIHYMSLDHLKAHELTNHIVHPSPAPGWRSPGAPGSSFKFWVVRSF